MHSAQADVLLLMRKGLHDLAQPLTALQCRLWLGTMNESSEFDVCATLQESLHECERMIAGLRAMQTQVESALKNGVN